MSTYPTTRIIKHTDRKDWYLILLPCEGSPYIHACSKKTSMDLLQKGVGGFFEMLDRSLLRIHPMFCENRRWDIARQMLAHKSTKVYVNEDGIEKCRVNMATICHLTNGCPHLSGNVILEVRAEFFDVTGIKPESMNLLSPVYPDGKEDPDFIGWEFEDQKEIDEFKAYAKAKGWDFDEDTGLCYASPTIFA